MRPLIGKDIREFSVEDWTQFITTRRNNRLITPGRSPKGKTASALSKAWSIPVDTLLTAFSGTFGKSTQKILEVENNEQGKMV